MPPTRTLQHRAATGLLAGGLVLTLGLGFGQVIHQQAARARADLADLRADNPAAYLDEIRWTRGFPAYLEALRRVEHFDRWREQAPPFLIGRWTEVDADRNDLAAKPEPHCRNGYVFEDGRLRHFGSSAFTRSADYRITAELRIEVRSGGRVLSLEPDPGWAKLYHLTLRHENGGTEEDLAQCA